MRRTVGLLLSFNGGYVDTAGFLALQGLFTAHVTGNFVTLGAAIVQGTSGAIAKLAALPVFCAMILACRFLSGKLAATGRPILPWMLALKAILLGIGGVMALAWGPFATSDSGTGLLTGMTLVAAMALQNASHRVHLAKEPPSTLMTGTSTQIMLDVADALSRRLPREERSQAAVRARTLALNVLVFAAGCLSAACMIRIADMAAFLLPPFVTAAAAFVSRKEQATGG